MFLKKLKTKFQHSPEVNTESLVHSKRPERRPFQESALSYNEYKSFLTGTGNDSDLVRRACCNMRVMMVPEKSSCEAIASGI